MPGTLANYGTGNCRNDRVGDRSADNPNESHPHAIRLEQRIGHEGRGECNAKHTPHQEPRLNSREVPQNAFGYLRGAAIAFRQRLQARFTERVEARANSCEQRAQTHAADNRGG